MIAFDADHRALFHLLVDLVGHLIGDEAPIKQALDFSLDSAMTAPTFRPLPGFE